MDETATGSMAELMLEKMKQSIAETFCLTACYLFAEEADVRDEGE